MAIIGQLSGVYTGISCQTVKQLHILCVYNQCLNILAQFSITNWLISGRTKFRIFKTLVYTRSLDYSGMYLLRKSSILWKYCWLKYDRKKFITDLFFKLFELWVWEIPCGNMLTAASLQRVISNNFLLGSQQMNGIDNDKYWSKRLPWEQSKYYCDKRTYKVLQ